MEILLSNVDTVVAYDTNTGYLTSFIFHDGKYSVVSPGRAFEIDVDGEPFLETDAVVPARYEVEENGRTIRFFYEHDGLRLTHTATLDASGAYLTQGLVIDVLEGETRQLAGVNWRAFGLIAGAAPECLLQIPGHILPPDISYATAARMPLDRAESRPNGQYPQGWLESAPDQVPGLIAVEDRVSGHVVGAWHDTRTAPDFPTFDGVGTLVNVEHRHRIAAWLKPGVQVVSDGYQMLCTAGGLDNYLAEYRRRAYGPLGLNCADRPAWVDDIRLVQIIANSAVAFAPRLGQAPIAEWHQKLPSIKALGFNVVYMLPIWTCQEANVYALSNHYEIDPRVGTQAEMREFVAEAHRLGLRVLFDLIPQGTGDVSAFAKEHPDWLVRDELGRPFGSHGWGPRAGDPPNGHTYSVDWGNPDYRKWIIDWALWNIETFNIDGFRTDALGWKEPNLGPDNPRAAWETSFGGVLIAEELRENLAKSRPEFLLLGEVWGPIFARGHHATYEYGWLLPKVNASWLQGQPLMSARQWMRWHEVNAAAFPDNMLRANFTLNHDNTHLLDEAQSPVGNAVSFMHIFTPGLPFVFWPELENREVFFQSALHARADLDGYVGSYGLKWTSHDDLYASYWQRDGYPPVIALANISQTPLMSPVQLPIAVAQVHISSLGATIRTTENGTEVELPAGGYLLCQLALGRVQDGATTVTSGEFHYSPGEKPAEIIAAPVI